MRRLSKFFLHRKSSKNRPRIRFLTSGFLQGSDMFLESENFLISGFSKRVSSVRQYRNVFHRGEKILDLHFDIKNPESVSLQEANSLSEQFISLFPELKRHGYAGFAGDTPNLGIVEFFRWQGAQIMRPPLLVRIRTKRRYRRAGYPARYNQKPVYRIVVRF